MTLIQVPSENQEQRALVTWLRYHQRLNKYFCKFNNEGKRTAAQGFNLKLMGLIPGATDLIIFYPTRTYHGLFLEVKRNKRYSPSERRTNTWLAQEEFIENVKSVGYEGKFCYGCIDGINIIESYLLT